jgi:hypothetical protein
MRVASGLISAVFLAAGCAGDSGPRLVPVSGTVTLNGKPLEGAVVTFVPDAANKEGRPGEDITGPEGNYKVMTSGRSGVVPGKYKVTITKAPALPSGPAMEAHKDDPFMAQLTAQGPDAEKAAKKKGAESMKIEGQFDRDVGPTGGTQDFDVKAAAKAAGTS